jgi:pentatricopeptide repeat protein
MVTNSDILIDIMEKRRNIAYAYFWRDKVTERGLKPDAITLGILIRGSCKRQDIKKALETYEELK